MEGRTFWITGLSGAGKTTIGRLWYEELRASGVPAVFLDGDRMTWATVRRTAVRARGATASSARCWRSRG